MSDFEKFLWTITVLFICLFGLIPMVVNANEVNGSYIYRYELNVNDNSYYIQLNDINNYFDYYVIAGENQYEMYVEINGKIYDRLIINNSENLGGIEIYFYDLETNDIYYLLRWYQEVEYIDKHRYNLYYDKNNYMINLDHTINIFMYFSNKISGYYTFNRDLQGLNFIDYDFNDSITTYKINGSLVYQTIENNYLFNNLEINPNNPELNIYLFNPSGKDTNYYVDGTFTEDYLRYFYFDSQYIDTILYEFLKLNGVFEFSYAGLGYHTSFWDLINAYVNIPVEIIKGILDISIFNTGITILVVFASILTIFIAFKIVKLINWS